MGARLRAAAGTAAVVPIGAMAVGVGLVKRNKRDAINFASERWIDTFFAINGVTVNVVGDDNAWKQRPAVFIFNHRNNFDAFIAAKIVRRDFTGVAKKALDSGFQSDIPKEIPFTRTNRKARPVGHGVEALITHQNGLDLAISNDHSYNSMYYLTSCSPPFLTNS